MGKMKGERMTWNLLKEIIINLKEKTNESENSESADERKTENMKHIKKSN